MAKTKKINKWKNGLLPVILMSFATGSVYCWTLFVDRILNHSDVFSPTILAWAFSLALFSLGISAALGGKLVENNIKMSSLLTFLFFTGGWLITGIGIQFELPGLVLLGFGPIQGVGLGLGYLAPVKTLMMWFHENKGLAAGIAIAAFGLSGMFGNPLIEAFLQSGIIVYHAFYLLTLIYGIALLIAYLTMDRPTDTPDMLTVGDDAGDDKVYSFKEIVFSRKFIFLWVVLFLNITCGLAIIGNERQIYLTLGFTDRIFGINGDTIIVIFTSLNAFGNLIGRVICAAAQDKTNKKYFPYYIMTIVSIAICLLAIMLPFASGGYFILVLTVMTIFVIQFFFGAGFACLPNILEQEYGMKQIATIQGYMLTAWAVAGLVGNQISTFILGDFSNPSTINTLYVVLSILYFVQLVFLVLWVRNKIKKDKLAITT